MPPKHGKIINQKLVLTPATEEGAKEILFMPIPAFNQEAQAVVHSHYAETETAISVHNKIIDLPPEEADEEDWDDLE